MKFIRTLLYLFAVGAVIVTLWQMNMGEAHAIQKPSIMQGSADLNKADNAAKDIVEFVLNAGLIIATVAFAVSVVMCTPFIGKREVGLQGVKGSLIVMATLGFIYIIFAFIGKVIT
jgi:hypothetical protein